MKLKLKFITCGFLRATVVMGVGLCSLSAKEPTKEAPSDASRIEYFPVREFVNNEQASGFMKLAQRKQMTEEDFNVLQRLQHEKESEYDQLDGELLKKFSLSSALEYEYEASTKTIYRKVSNEGEERKTIYQFTGEDEEQTFLRLIAAKRLTANATATIKLLILEKEKELQLLDQQMSERFGVVHNLDYYYDAKKMTLFEVRERKP